MESLSRRDALRVGVAGTAMIGGAVVAPSAANAEQTGALAAGPGEGWISVLDHGAVGDGSTDDTAALQAAFDAARATTPAKSVHLPPGRTFKVSDELAISGMTDFVISGYGATIALANPALSEKGQKNMLRVTGCQRFKILGLALRDTDRIQRYNGIGITSCTAGVVDGVRVQDVRWNGIIIFDRVPGTSDDITITNCTTEGTRFGISSNGKDIRIVNNHVAMDWLSTDEAKRNGGRWNKDSDYYDGICVWAGGERTVISGNTVTECGQCGIYTEEVYSLVVSGNTVVDCQNRGIEVDGSKRPDGSLTGTAVGVTISGNAVRGCWSQINVVRSRDVSMVGNRTESPDPEISVSCIAINEGTSQAVVVGNHARQARTDYPALYVHEQSTDVTLAWNQIQAAVPYQVPASVTVIDGITRGVVKTQGKLIAQGGIGVGNSVAARQPGSVVRKIEVFSSTGASLGWIPVYSSIT
jgi:parallel beta-helix repeat protein